MYEREQIMALIWDAIDEVNELLPADAQIAKADDTVLLGASGNLDSFGLVSLVVALEQRIEDRWGVSLTLADEKAMSYSRSPFRTVQTLCDYVDSLLKNAAHA